MTTAPTPEPPYYAVIFTTVRRIEPGDGYEETSERMHELARAREGFLGVESARDELGITVSYWSDLDAIAGWKSDAEHQLAQANGRDRWYARYMLRIARVEKAYGFAQEE